MNVLKALGDALSNAVEKSVVFLVNVRADKSINFICRSNIASCNAGYLVKEAALHSAGNGGGSATFAQGGGKTTEHLAEMHEMLRDALAHEK